MKKIICLVLMATMLCVLFCGCTEANTSQEEESSYQEALMQQSNDAVGMPNITNFYEKKIAKEIFEKRDDSELICYAYTYSDMTGLYSYKGQCMGYGLPYSTQYTCPEKIARGYSEYITVPQADPNGLYSSGTTAATWLMMIDEVTGETYVSYNEPNMTIEEHKLPARLCLAATLPSDY